MYYSFNKKTEHTLELIFVSKAVLKKDESRPHMQLIYSNGEEIVATDGHRLHHYKPEVCPLPEGYYAVKKRTKTVLELLKVSEDLPQYPDFNRIMPNPEGLISFPTKGDECYPMCEHGKFATVVRAMENGTLNFDLFRDATHDDLCMYKVDGMLSPVMMKGGFLTAVIMPMRIS